eukprot:CAMPEP_0182574906 /NCGR_PEP_ID=MMETSP1324-20130603/27894_1 /TAXON_ID=236786 /ORGANISM="Florenciella sp., Strain RCC1587" /LENGTH=193 /DNA_ID=CAMNT_0024790393 /DNA_START=69 /DNA_END=646 /DNA_ORIENTATION=-
MASESVVKLLGFCEEPAAASGPAPGKELSLKANDVIVIKRTDASWVFGELLTGSIKREGWVPKAIIQELSPFRAEFQYQAASEMELSFMEGDILHGLRQADGWWTGCNQTNGLFGDFPANYIQAVDVTDAPSVGPAVESSSPLTKPVAPSKPSKMASPKFAELNPMVEMPPSKPSGRSDAVGGGSGGGGGGGG